MSGRGRVGHRQLAEIRNRLSGRDIQVLHSLRNYRFLRVDHIQGFYFTGHANPASASRLARRTLSRLHRFALVDRLERRIGGVRAGSAGHVYTLSPLGHRLLESGSRKRRWEPSLHHLAHTLAIADIAVAVYAYAADRLDNWTIQPEPAAWRSYHHRLSQVTLKPDLFIQVADADFELNWFVEIDCGTESQPTLRRKAAAYSDYRRAGIEQDSLGVFPFVAWIAPNDERADQIQRALASDQRLDLELHHVTTVNGAVEIITDLTRGP